MAAPGLGKEFGQERQLFPDVEQLLQELRYGDVFGERRNAAQLLGTVEFSSAEIVHGLVDACVSDISARFREPAAEALDAPVHRRFLARHPDLYAQTQQALDHVALAGSEPSDLERTANGWGSLGYTGRLTVDLASFVVGLAGMLQGLGGSRRPEQSTPAAERLAGKSGTYRSNEWNILRRTAPVGQPVPGEARGNVTLPSQEWRILRRETDPTSDSGETRP